MHRELRKGDRVFTVSAFLITRDKPRRALLIKHHKLDKWLQPGGHVERDQDPIMALIEEFEVEVGINLEPYLRSIAVMGEVEILPAPAHLASILMPANRPNPGDPEHYMIDLGYLIYVPQALDVKSGVEHIWADRAALGSLNVPPDIRAFLRHHLTA